MLAIALIVIYCYWKGLRLPVLQNKHVLGGQEHWLRSQTHLGLNSSSTTVTIHMSLGKATNLSSDFLSII